MDPQDAIDFSREAITTCICVGGPILAVSLAIGLVVSVFQAMTQLHDQSISFVPKILLMLVAIAVCLPWLSGKMIDFTKYSLEKPVVFQPEFDSTQSAVEKIVQRIGSPTDPSFRFEWADEGSEPVRPSYEMPTLRSADARSQPQFKPKLELQPRKAAPFKLPVFRQALAPENGNEFSDEF